MKCWAESYCKMHNTEHCNEYCDYHVLMKVVYNHSNIPKRYQYPKALAPSQTDLNSFIMLKAYMDNVVENISEGLGLYIFSANSGNGKTSWVTKIANEYVRKCVARGHIEDVIYFVNVPQYLELIRDSIRSENKELNEMKRRIMHSDLVIFDDIGAEVGSNWVAERLYELISYRDGEEKTTLYTSNCSLGELERTLGIRTCSRIKGHTSQVQFVGNDNRGSF